MTLMPTWFDEMRGQGQLRYLQRSLQERWGGTWEMSWVPVPWMTVHQHLVVSLEMDGERRECCVCPWLGFPSRSPEALVEEYYRAAELLVPERVRQQAELAAQWQTLIRRGEDHAWPPKRVDWRDQLPEGTQHFYCRECHRRVGDYKPVVGSYSAPERWAAARSRGIDPATNHKTGCSRMHQGKRRT